MVSAMRVGQPHHRRATRSSRRAATRAPPALAASGFSVGQISTSPAWPARSATCRIGSARRRQPRRAPGRRRSRSTAASSGSTERNDRVSGTRRHGRPAALGAARRTRRPTRRTLRRGALEAVDRLLLVADREQRARHVARAAAGEELLGQRARPPATAPGSYPAPRRPGCGRGRRRACRAPTRPPPTMRSRLAALPIRSSKSSAARRALASP